MHLKCQLFPYKQAQIFRNGDGRESAKKRHIAMQSTNKMWDPLERCSVQYEKNLLKTVGVDTFF